MGHSQTRAFHLTAEFAEHAEWGLFQVRMLCVLQFPQKCILKSIMHFLGKWFIGFGVFLIVCGILGFASNPAAAKTALITGSFFGGLNLLMGWGLLHGFSAVRYVAAPVTVLLIAAFSWRSYAGWVQVADGEPKVFAASLISTMLIGAILTLIQLVRNWR
jgi:uncharacterized membrane protein (UPF0136 family)